MKIQLSEREQFTCHAAALMLAINNENYNKQDYWTVPQDNTLHEWLASDAEAIGSEWAVAKYFNLKFDPFLQKGKRIADVGKGLEIKWSKHESASLIVYEYDRATDVAVLVTGKGGNYRIAGWIPVAMAQKPRYRHTKQPTWWVTQINLQPIENLVKSSYADAAI
jgi:hypothetical protein